MIFNIIYVLYHVLSWIFDLKKPTTKFFMYSMDDIIKLMYKKIYIILYITNINEYIPKIENVFKGY